MNERDNGTKPSGFRASIDDYASTVFSTRKRTSCVNSPNTIVSEKSKESNKRSSVGGGSIGGGGGGVAGVAGASAGNQKSKGIMSFFSRFGQRKIKSKLSFSSTTKSDSPAHSRGSSLPNTPVTYAGLPLSVKHRISTPILSPAAIFRSDPQTSPAPSIPDAERLPLCVARIESIKVSSLPACTLSTEKILRRESVSGWSSTRSRVMRTTHMPTRSADLDWTTKLFILRPGLILQYAGYGTEDRLPEKIMQLTSDSLAFATDVIPGRPYVLQITKSACEDGHTSGPGKRNTFIAKVTFRSTAAMPSVLLLVFENAEEMDTWMGLIRAEANRLGAGGLPDEDVKEDPEAEQNGELEISPAETHVPSTSEENDSVTVMEDTDRDEELPEREPESEPSPYDNPYSRRITINRDDFGKNEWSSSDESKRASTYYRSSTDAGRSIISGDQITLEQLRGPSRLSIHSGRGRTHDRVSTVSPDTSPERSSMGGSMSYRRRSAALSTRSRSSIELRNSQHPLSAIDRDGNLYWIPRSPSPVTTSFSLSTPNFSMPNITMTTSTATTTAPMTRPLSIPHYDTRANLATVDSFDEIAALHPISSSPRPRPVSIQSNPGLKITPHKTRTSTRSPTSSSKQRPASMIDTRSPSSHPRRSPKTSSGDFSNLPPLPASPASPGRKSNMRPPQIALPHIPARSKSLKRRSLSAMSLAADPELALGAPRHPPPNIPLPALPAPLGDISLLSQSLPRESPKDMERRERRRRSRMESAGDTAASTISEHTGRLSVDYGGDRRHLGNRRSFCSSREELGSMI